MRHTYAVSIICLVSVGMFAQSQVPAATGAQLDIQRTCSLAKSWNDKGSGADLNGFFYLPYVDSSQFIIGGYGTQSKKLTAEDCVLTAMESEQLVEPVTWELIWLDKGSGARKDGSMWRAVPPGEDYHCIGTVPQIDYDKPDLSNYRCVPTAFTEHVVTSDVIWTDEGSGAKQPVSIFKLPNSGSFVAVPGRLAQVEAVDLRLAPPVSETASVEQTAPQGEAATVEVAPTEVEQIVEEEQPMLAPDLTGEEAAEKSDSPSVASEALALLKKMDKDTIKEVLSAVGVTGDSDESKTEPEVATDTGTSGTETEGEEIAEQPAADVNESVSDGSSVVQDSEDSSVGQPETGQQAPQKRRVGAEPPSQAAVLETPRETSGTPVGVVGETEQVQQLAQVPADLQCNHSNYKTFIFDPDKMLALREQGKTCELGGLTFEKEDFRDAILVGVNFRGSEFVLVKFNGANLFDANMTDTEHYLSYFNDHEGVKTVLEKTDFTNAVLSSGSLINANMKEATLIGVSFSVEEMSGADVTGADFTDILILSFPKDTNSIVGLDKIICNDDKHSDCRAFRDCSHPDNPYC